MHRISIIHVIKVTDHDPNHYGPPTPPPPPKKKKVTHYRFVTLAILAAPAELEVETVAQSPALPQELASGIYTGCPIKNGTVDFQYIASGKLSIFLRHRIKYFPQKRMTPKSLNLMK